MITIVEPTNPERVATTTRENLQKLVQASADPAERVIVDLTKEEISLIKERVACTFTGEEQTEAELAISLQASLINGAGTLFPREYYTSGRAAMYTYALEAAFGLVKKAKFTRDIQKVLVTKLHSWGDVALNWADVFEAPRNTTGGQDELVRVCIMAKAKGPVHVISMNEWVEAFTCSYHSNYQYPDSHWLIPYATSDGPWIAGILDYNDLGKAKFIRKRLGAFLSSLGHDDSVVRASVERHKRLLAVGDFTVYPNDIPWGYVYSDVCTHSSCMSGDADDFEGHLHPVDAYSSAHWGSGDNNLAVVLSADGTSRAILNTDTMKYVRWYGVDRHKVSLDALGCEEDSCALSGSWLAMLVNEHDPSQIIGPYIDGSLGNGRIDTDEERVYLCQSGFDMSETCGIYDVPELEEQVTCAYSDDEYPMSSCTWLNGDEVWIADCYSNKWRTCRLSGLYYLKSNMREICLNGNVYWVANEQLNYADVWEDGNGDYWDAEYEAAVWVGDQQYRESDCIQKKDGTWVLECDYVEEDDEAA